MSRKRTVAEPTALLAANDPQTLGHFEYTSGLHGAVYIAKYRPMQHPILTSWLVSPLVQHYHALGIDLVVGPATGGAIIAYEVARQLTPDRDGGVRYAIAENGIGSATMGFRPDLRPLPSDRVLIVDDVLTTGGTIRKVIAAVEAIGSVIVGIGIVYDRSAEPVDLGYPTKTAFCIPGITYEKADCPLCKDGVPLTRPKSW